MDTIDFSAIMDKYDKCPRCRDVDVNFEIKGEFIKVFCDCGFKRIEDEHGNDWIGLIDFK